MAIKSVFYRQYYQFVRQIWSFCFGRGDQNIFVYLFVKKYFFTSMDVDFLIKRFMTITFLCRIWRSDKKNIPMIMEFIINHMEKIVYFLSLSIMSMRMIMYRSYWRIVLVLIVSGKPQNKGGEEDKSRAIKGKK